jgi:hypothetical protein
MRSVGHAAITWDAILRVDGVLVTVRSAEVDGAAA